MQTLIVTAVLVLMAVAAGVLIVAITRSSSDDLQDQTAKTDGPCNEVEIYDVQIAGTGQPGVTAGFEGSAVGCVPVCVLDSQGRTITDKNNVMWRILGVRLYTPDDVIDWLPETREYLQGSLEYTSLDGVDEDDDFPGVTKRQNPDRIEVVGQVIPRELGAQKFLMRDSTHFFANTPEGRNRLMEGADFGTTYNVASIRLNTAKDKCDTYDVRGEVAEETPIMGQNEDDRRTREG